MGGNFNGLGNDIQTSGFTLDRRYNHLVVEYDALNRVTSAIYYNTPGTADPPLESFSISYTVEGFPVENGTIYKNHVFDLYQGRFQLIGDATPSGEGSKCCGFTQIVRGSAHQQFLRNGVFYLLSNSANEPLIWQSVAEFYTIVSASAEDNTIGSGIQTLDLTGLDGSGNEITESIPMNGTTPVVSLLEYRRLNSCIASSVGSYGYGRGRITVTNNTSLNLVDSISPNNTRSTSLKYSVPSNNKLSLKGIRLNACRLGTFEVKLIIWDSTGVPNIFLHTEVESTSFLHIFPAEHEMAAGNDVALIIIQKAGNNGSDSLFTAELYGEQTIVI